MTKPNSRIVQRHDDDGWEVRKPGASRASAVEATQAEAIQRARDILKNDGGGELKVRSEKGNIRQQDTIYPGNDPRSSKG
ncbi:hypothetical protein BKH06_12650 [Actinomyces naeslundii]|jgi:hypothetical protein|uniref:DUF2188 domain-containing protein n=1 Tax=Actinomyces naeslundii TaxID=1655 RepID=UPI00096F6421|nr:DUF2188 domain-containing protein [Actinomyces naeslundii]OMG07933.1 hypothetical protein BKH06_12650 [Actinomyces naeslundii]